MEEGFNDLIEQNWKKLYEEIDKMSKFFEYSIKEIKRKRKNVISLIYYIVFF